MKGLTMQLVMDVPQQALQSLQRGQQSLVIVNDTYAGARRMLKDLGALADAAGLETEAHTTLNSLQLRVRHGGGSVRIVSLRQATTHGALRGMSVDLVLHPDDALLPEIIPTLLTRQGLAVNYVTGTGAGPAHE